MINFSRAFDLAWERMMAILFRPFDLGRWFVIGFSAFLAGLLAGGNGFNGFNVPNYQNRTYTPTTSFQFHSNMPSLSSGMTNFTTALSTGVGIFLIVVIGFFVLAFAVLLYWLGSRGQFLFLDNVVRNRGAIAWPWQAYARQGNNLFVFCLLWLLIVLVVMIPFVVAGIFLALPFMHEHRWPEGGEWAVPALLGAAYFIVSLVLSVIFFLFREFGVPLMFRNGLTARAAFGETMGLVQRFPGAVTLFVLLRIALFIALVIFSLIVCCFSCCVEMIPYLGTVLLLPALIFIKCFTLEVLAQFGPEYNVWTIDVPPTPGINPPPPPG